MSADEECVGLLMPLVGAEEPTEVACMSSLTTNLHLLMCAFYQPTQERYKILLEDGAFSSDQVVDWLVSNQGSIMIATSLQLPHKPPSMDIRLGRVAA